MSWYIPGTEPGIRAPREYQEHINRIGGSNRYGEPNFRLVWGQSAWDLVYGTDGNGAMGQHWIPKHGNVPAWFIEAWKPPETLGSPELWYSLTWDWDADRPGIGAFPERGIYMPVAFNLFARYFENGVMRIDAMPLTHWLIDLIVPNLLKDLDTTYTQRKAAILARREAERRKSEQLAMDAYLDAAPAFGGVSGTYESNREAWEQRIREKQAGMKISRDEIVRRMGLGHKQQRW